MKYILILFLAVSLIACSRTEEDNKYALETAAKICGSKEKIYSLSTYRFGHISVICKPN